MKTSSTQWTPTSSLRVHYRTSPVKHGPLVSEAAGPPIRYLCLYSSRPPVTHGPFSSSWTLISHPTHCTVLLQGHWWSYTRKHTHTENNQHQTLNARQKTLQWKGARSNLPSIMTTGLLKHDLPLLLSLFSILTSFSLVLLPNQALVPN